MNRVETLLCVLAEECAEVAQRCSKAQRFGPNQIQAGQHDTNAERIDHELQDLYGVIEMLRSELGGWFGVHEDVRIQAKKRKVERYMAADRDLQQLDREASSS